MRNQFNGLIKKLASSIENKKRGSELDRILSCYTFHPFLQPIVMASNNHIIGCEVLLRLYKGDCFFSPLYEISILESSEYMNEITHGLLDDVSDYFFKYREILPANFYFSFNIHPSQLYSKKLVKRIISFSDIFEGCANLVLEIIERDGLDFNNEISSAMLVLTSSGVRFAIDDFGVGASYLKYIESPSFSMIKIDRDFTMSSQGILVHNKIIEAIVILASRLGLSVVAEGVEDDIQRKLLRKAGVDAMQGYYFSEPIRMQDFKERYLPQTK